MTDGMRITPRPSIAWAIGLLYGPAFIALLLASGVDYDTVADSTHNFVRAVVIPMAILTVVVIALTTWLGWWRPVLRDDRPAPRWMISIPIVFAIAILAGIDYGRVADLQTSFLLWAAVGTLMVGFCEETVYRGLAVVGFREGYSEVRVWLFSSLLFMLLHAWNLVAGQSLPATVSQLGFTFVLGSILYAVRRTSGTLIIPILLHAGWDWMSFTGASDAFKDAADLVDPRAFSPAFAGIGVMVILFLVGAKRLLHPESTAQPS
jgi:membrane protease YdiL (CAAX protease family)